MGARKVDLTKLPKWTGGRSFDELVLVSRADAHDKPPPVADLRMRIVQVQEMAARVCAGALKALASPFAPGSIEALDAFDRMFSYDGSSPDTEPPWLATIGGEVIDAGWALKETEAILSWGDVEWLECPDFDPSRGKCGTPVKKGHRLCWHCEIDEKRHAARAAGGAR